MSLARGCRLVGISTQAVYQHRDRQIKRTDELAVISEWIGFYRQFMPKLGGRKLYYLVKPKLIETGIKLGRDGFFDYLREHDLLVKPKRSYTKTTNSKHWLKKHPNLLKDDSNKAIMPEQVLVADITYVKSGEGTHYLSLVTDAYSRQIMGYHLSEDMRACNVVKALKMAQLNRNYHHAAIHHSDRGLQYCSALYQEALDTYQITPSMTDGYDCYQNALAERINGILKYEFLLYECNTFDELQVLIKESIHIYNEMRPHLSLNMLTPNQVHRNIGSYTQRKSQILAVSDFS